MYSFVRQMVFSVQQKIKIFARISGNFAKENSIYLNLCLIYARETKNY